jgi:hypothetical protein
MERFVFASAILLALTLLASPAPQPKERQADLQKQAKITMQQAQKTALARHAGVIRSKELEKENGKLVYSFDIKTRTGIHEVQVDAQTGEIVEDKIESAADEAKERQQEKATRSKAKSDQPAKQ